LLEVELISDHQRLANEPPRAVLRCRKCWFSCLAL